MATPSIERAEPNRLFPQLTVRRILWIVTLGAFLAWIGRLAYQGSPLPEVIILALGSALLFFVASAICFLIAWIPARVVFERDDVDQREGNPFAADQLPPQILPPKGPQ